MWKIVFPIFVTFFAVGLSVAPGGSQNADTNDRGFQSSLNFAVARFNVGNNADRYLFQVVSIVSAKVQVVEGSLYTIVVKLGRTNCKKGEPNTRCTVYTDPAKAQIFQCTFSVWSRPWLNHFQVLNEMCLKA